jgi:hypothetical protein
VQKNLINSLECFRLFICMNNQIYYVPSDPDLSQIFSILPDLESKKTFYKWHYLTIDYLLRTPFADYLRGDQVRHKSPKIVYDLCCAIGYSYESWCGHWFVSSYFQHVFAHGVVSPRSLSDRASKKKSALKELKAKGLEDALIRLSRSQQVGEYPQEPMVFSSYETAVTQRHAWGQAVAHASKENPIIDGLRTKLIESGCSEALSFRQLARTARPLSKVPYWCPYCKRLIEIQHGRGNPDRVHCGEPDCQKVYEQGRKAISRASALSVKDKLLLEWVPAKNGRCQGHTLGTHCKKNTSINQERFCKNCYHQILAERGF